MPRNQGTSRKGKPKKGERAAGMGRALQRAQLQQHGSRSSKASTGGMASSGAETIGDVEDTKGGRLRSVLELDDLNDFLGQAELAQREFVSEHESLVVLDDGASALNPNNTSAVASRFEFAELSVPRRPRWIPGKTTPEELDRMERESFLDWRRTIAQHEEQAMAAGESGPSGESRTRGYSFSTTTPFEKNLEVWRQLWRVLERSQILVQIVDARHVLFYLSSDLRRYAQDELGKPMFVLVNKADYLTPRQRLAWHLYFQRNDMPHAFFSAHIEQQALDQAARDQRRQLEREEQEKEACLKKNKEDLFHKSDDDDHHHDDHDQDEDDDTAEGEEKEEQQQDDDDKSRDEDDDNTFQDAQEGEESRPENDSTSWEHLLDDPAKASGVLQPLTRNDLMETLQRFAHEKGVRPKESNHGADDKNKMRNRIEFGMVGFPNVGKSSVINVLLGSSKLAHHLVRVGVAAQPGKTKHFATLLPPDFPHVVLCDCPGLVFPSLVSSTADLICAGVFPIQQMRDHWSVINLICHRIPRHVLNAVYGIQLPLPSWQELREQNLVSGQRGDGPLPLHVLERLPPPTAEELLETYCIARSLLAGASGGAPDYPRAARIIVNDYVSGKLLYNHAPPPLEQQQEAANSDANLGTLTSDEFGRETIRLSIQRTDRLRDKLADWQQEPQQMTTKVDVHEEAEADGNENEVVDNDADAGLDDISVGDDLDLLEAVGLTSSGGADDLTQSSSKRHGAFRKKKKKGRKDRGDADPYGCHRDNDQEMLSSVAAATKGVTVKAGRYSRDGYTRPSYVGAKGIAATTTTSTK